MDYQYQKYNKHKVVYILADFLPLNAPCLVIGLVIDEIRTTYFLQMLLYKLRKEYLVKLAEIYATDP